ESCESTPSSRNRAMKIRNLTIVAAVLMLGSMTVFISPAPTQEPPAQPEGVEVQARGPVHEAFAQPTAEKVEAGPVVPKQPPDAVEEQPPDQKPQGDNVQWIPGYWAWDDESNDFLWISGFWRDIPPGRSWV